jgi:CheY-like chemotaxis protein
MSTTALNAKPILLVEDDSVDAMTVRRALRDVGSTRLLVHQINGEEALKYLRAAADDDTPGLILLDLNMPRMNGLEFLEHKQADDRLRDVPVVVLTTSTNAKDIERSYELGVEKYLVKPIDYRKFIDLIKDLDVY